MQDRIELLERLAALSRAGMLTKAEFEQQKAAVLGQQDCLPHAASDEFLLTEELERGADEGAELADESWFQRLRRSDHPANKQVEKWVGYGGAAVVIVVALSYLGLGSPQVKWSLMTDEQLKRELLKSAEDSGGKVFACLQSDGDCGEAVTASKQTYALADRVCQTNPGGNACFLKEQAARSVSSIEFLQKTIGGLQRETEDQMLNSL